MVNRIIGNTNNESVDICFWVEDSGIGIAKEHMEVIFDAFEQCQFHNTNEHGVGLGLAITKRLVEIMGGVIKVMSLPQQGSRFIVALKNIRAITEASNSAKNNAPTANLRQLVHTSLPIDEEKVSKSETTRRIKASLELLSILEDFFLPWWQQLQDMLIIQDVKKFSAELSNVAQQYQLLNLLEYSRDLFECAQKYNVAELKQQLRRFPQLVNKLKIQ